jgi:hypothetical protein
MYSRILRGLSPNSDIHVSVSDIDIPRIGPQSTYLAAAKYRQTNTGNINQLTIVPLSLNIINTRPMVIGES